MPNSRRDIVIGVIALAALGLAAAAFIWFSGGSGEPSATISAISNTTAPSMKGAAMPKPPNIAPAAAGPATRPSAAAD